MNASLADLCQKIIEIFLQLLDDKNRIFNVFFVNLCKTRDLSIRTCKTKRYTINVGNSQQKKSRTVQVRSKTKTTLLTLRSVNRALQSQIHR